MHEAVSKQHQRQRAPRKWLVAMAMVCTVIVLVFLVTWFATRRQEVGSTTRVAATPRNLQGSDATTTAASPEYQRQLAEQNQAKVEQAEATGKTYVGIAGSAPKNDEPISLLEPQVPSTSTAPTLPPPPPPVDMPPAPPSMTEQGSSHQAIYQQIDQLEKRMDPGSHKIIPITFKRPALPTAERTEKETTGHETRNDANKTKTIVAPIRPGDVLVTVNDLNLNSDTPTPVIVTVIDGGLEGGKFFGKFQRQDTWLVLEFDRFLAPDGSMYRVRANAVDAHTPSMSVRSDVDHRTLRRWGGLLAANFVNSLGNAVRARGSTSITSVGPMTSITQNPNYSSRDIWTMAIGDTMKPMAEIAQQQFALPPKVTLNANETLGVLILEVGS